MIGRVAGRAHREFRYTMTTRQRSALVAYLSFAATIGSVRALTRSIRAGHGPFHDVSVGGLHIHHFLPGIALLAAAGALGVRGSERIVVHCALGATYGTGCALIVDELPLLVNLRDVYWTPQGRWAIEVAAYTIVGLGTYFSGLPIWRGVRHELAA